MTPLHLASKKGNFEAVGMLLILKANLYSVDSRKWTALHFATFYSKIFNFKNIQFI